MGPHASASVSRWQRNLTVVTVAAAASAMAAVMLAGALTVGPVPAGAAPLAASGQVRAMVRPAMERPAMATPSPASANQPGPRSPRIVHGGRPIPRTWPHSAPVSVSGAHLPPSVTNSLPSANWAGYEDTGAGPASRRSRAAGWCRL